MGTAPKFWFKIQKGNKQELLQYQGKTPAEKVAKRRKPSLKKRIEPMDLCLSTGGAGEGESSSGAWGEAAPECLCPKSLWNKRILKLCQNIYSLNKTIIFD